MAAWLGDPVTPHQTSFWRKTSAPSGEKHFGLGLSIVKACAEKLGGSCSVSLREEFFTVEILWPPEPRSGN
jgi:signal transduction histidine kinase